MLNLGSVIAIVFALLYYFVGQRNFFQERSETLLLNILPKEISDALKVDRGAIAAHYESASVLFADVVGFTPMAATMTPLRLVDLLNDVFRCFDDLVEKHDLEKIKTIGDCYMVAAGVPRERADHALALVQLALDMREPWRGGHSAAGSLPSGSASIPGRWSPASSGARSSSTISGARR